MEKDMKPENKEDTKEDMNEDMKEASPLSTKNGKGRCGDYVECFGEFSMEDTICKKFCALNLSCAIEKGQIEKMEILDDFLFFGNSQMRVQ